MGRRAAALSRLQEIGLVSVSENGAVDCHPLLREYFAMRLRQQNPDGFRAAHSRLFDHLCVTTEHRPDTLPGLQPLCQAVPHGCLAGRQQEAVVKGYRDRILRGTGDDGFYTWKKLGAIAKDLGALAAFFEEQWTRLSPNLSVAAQAWLLSETAVRLRALGRLTEAVEPMRVTLEINAKAEDWMNAAVAAGNLSNLQVTLGRLDEAVAEGRRAVEFALRSGNPLQEMARRTDVADALHYAGRRAEAGRCSRRRSGCRRRGSRSSRCSIRCRVSAMPIYSWPPPNAPRGNSSR